MAMGTRKQREKQEDLWIAHTELASAPGHPFYQRLNELLEAERFDEFVETRCAKFYAEKNGRPSLTPGIHFRALLIGYFDLFVKALPLIVAPKIIHHQEAATKQVVAQRGHLVLGQFQPARRDIDKWIIRKILGRYVNKMQTGTNLEAGHLIQTIRETQIGFRRIII